jgi:delta 1-pyrroline-5-carboxylate dehydrogenase
MASSFENENTVFRVAQTGKTAEWDREFEAAVAELRKRAGQTHPMLIGGREVAASATFDSHDPSTGEVVARFPKGTQADVDAAVKAAKAAQPAWEARGWEARAAIIEKAADIMRRRRPELAALMTIENGKNRA